MDIQNRRVRTLLSASATVTAATVVANLLSYLLVAAGTRVLGPDRYAELAALLGLQLVGSVPATTIQVVFARRVAVGETGGLGPATVRTCLAVTVIGAAAVPFLHPTLRISVLALVFLVITLPALIIAGAAMGAVQGLHLFGRLGLITMLAAAGRVGGGILGMAASDTATAAMAGMAIGSWLGAFACLAATRGPGWQALIIRAGTGSRAGREIGHASVTMLALATIMTVDVLLAKRYLPATEAGLYGAGNLVTKAAIWLPYSVTMIALPRLAVGEHRRGALRVSIAVLAALGVLEIAGVLLLGRMIFPLAVGSEYGDVIGWLWLFAAAGAVLAITQLVIMSRIAATDRRVPALLWAGLIAEVAVVAVWHGSIGTILTIATITGVLVTVAGLVIGSASR
jgi:O-antigen/teichoic acid export membrane protein